MLPQVCDHEVATELLEEIDNGVAIGRSAAAAVVRSANWPSALLYRDKVSRIVEDDLRLGRLHGPFVNPPYDTYVVSPLGAFPKRDMTKIRVIHDLSYPHAESVNSQIDPAEYSLQYSSVDDAVEACMGLSDPHLANIDIRDAYKSILVRPQDWHLLGFEWQLGDAEPALFFSRVLSFGLRSAPALFDKFAVVLQKFMVAEGVADKIIRYVDDFLLVGPSVESVNLQLEVMIQVARRAGFTIQDSKVTGACKCIEFLGIIIDTERGVTRISDDRLAEIRALLAQWLDKRVCSKRQLLKIIGKLAFAARVVRSGRAFLGRLIGLSKKIKALHHRVRVSEAARKDLIWWSECIATHNGVSMVRPDFLSGETHHLFTDASNHGYGGYFDGNWFATSYTGESAPLVHMSINWRELHAALKALATWGPAIAGQRAVFHIDNSATVFILRKLYTPVADLMDLVRSWCLLLEQFKVQLSIEYISTHDNVDADMLSRGEIDAFLARHAGVASRVWPEPVWYYDKLV